MIVVGQSGCIPAKMVEFGRSCCIWPEVVVFVHKWLYSGKVFVFGQKLVVFGPSGCIWAQVVVVEQK